MICAQISPVSNGKKGQKPGPHLGRSGQAGRQKGGGGVKGTKKIKNKNSVEGRKWEEKKFLFRLDEKFNLGSFYIAVTYLLT